MVDIYRQSLPNFYVALQDDHPAVFDIVQRASAVSRVRRTVVLKHRANRTARQSIEFALAQFIRITEWQGEQRRTV